MKINELTVKSACRFLWLKKVVDVDLSKHCSKSLIGDYIETIQAEQEHYENVDLQNGIYYLCGVVVPFIWENNIHLAFRYSAGDRVKIDNDFYKVDIEDAELIEITKEQIDYTLPKAKFKTYNTCRNWWFANWFKKNI